MEILVNVVCFFIGYGVGLASGFMLKSKTALLKNIRMNDFVAFMVVSIWVLSMIIDIMSTTYETSPLVHGLMGAIVGFFYKQKFEEKKA